MSDDPNVLVVWTDEQAIDTMSAYGNDQIETPNLDRLAESGVVFENAYCTSPVCTPSRSSIMTGQWPHENGCVLNNVPLAEEIPCLPELVDADYATGYIGKWHLGDEIFPQHGFEEWISIEDNYIEYYSEGRPRGARSDYHDFLVENGFDPDVETEDGPGVFSRAFAADLPEEYSKPKFMADRANEFIADHRDEPFLLSVMFLEPHFPYTSARDDQYDPDEVPLPPNFEHDGFADQSDFIRDRREEWLETRHPLDGEPPMTEAGWRELVSNYWGLVSLVDTHVGRILDTLEEHGVADDTIVVFTSDHGDQLGSQKLWRKNLMFEESARIPLLMRVPDGVDTQRVEARMSQIDLVPTILDAMDQPRPDFLSGDSWLPHLRGERDRGDEDVFIEYNRHTQDARAERANLEGASPETIREAITKYNRCIVTADGLKYVYRSHNADSLYDLNDDPNETRNLVDDPAYRGTVTELEERLADLQRRVGDPLPGPT